MSATEHTESVAEQPEQPEQQHEPEQPPAPDAEPDTPSLPDEPGGDAPDEPDTAAGLDEPSPPAMSEKEIEKRMQALERERTRHANRVSEIMGEDAQELELCPLCFPPAPGFVLLPYLGANLAQVQRDVRDLWGEPTDPAYPPAGNARRCDACDGYGKRTSGSRVPDQRALVCADCNGKGWVQVGGSAPHPDLAATNGDVIAEPVVAGEDKPEADPWGRPVGDENYGRLPQYVTP